MTFHDYDFFNNFFVLFFSATEPDGMHVIIDRHLITGQNDTSTLSAVQNLILLCNARLDSKFEISFLHIEEPGNSPQAEASFLFFPLSPEKMEASASGITLYGAQKHIPCTTM